MEMQKLFLSWSKVTHSCLVTHTPQYWKKTAKAFFKHNCPTTIVASAVGVRMLQHASVTSSTNTILLLIGFCSAFNTVQYHQGTPTTQLPNNFLSLGYIASPAADNKQTGQCLKLFIILTSTLMTVSATCHSLHTSNTCMTQLHILLL